MPDPRLAALARSGRRSRPLLSPAAARAQVRGQGPERPPSFGDQLSDLVSGMPAGFFGLAKETAATAVGFPRLAAYELGGLARGEGIKKPSDDFGTNLHEFFPLLETLRSSNMRTAQRLSHPGEYVTAAREGRILPAIVEDAANVSIVAAPAAKAAGAAAGRAAVAEGATAAGAEQAAARAGAEVTAKVGAEAGGKVAGETGARAGAHAAASAGAEAGAEGARRLFQPRFLTKERFPMPSELSAEQVARPRVLQAAQALERVGRPATEVANAPARVWTAPYHLFRGVKLPRGVFGETEAGAARQFGVMPALEATGISPKIAEIPAVKKAAERVSDWRETRRQVREMRTETLLPFSARSHIEAHAVARDLVRAARVLGNDDNLMHALHIVRTGTRGVIEQLPAAERRIGELGLGPEAYEQLVMETFGIEQRPTPETVKTVLDYANGTLDPAVRARLDTAGEFYERALGRHQQTKLEREQLNPEQTEHAPMTYKTEQLMEPSRTRAEALTEEIEGYETPGGEYVPGIRAKLAQAEAAVPAANLEQLVGQRNRTLTRRAGALEREVEMAGQTAERSYGQAETVAQQADRARASTLRGARDEMAEMQRRYGFGGEYQPEWMRGQLEIGRAERAAEPGATGYMIPEAEYQLAERIARLEGEGGTRGLEQALSRAAAATEKAAGAAERGVQARGRIFTEAAEPVARPEATLAFGQMSEAERAAFSQMSDAEAAKYVRGVRTRVRDEIRGRRTELENRIAAAGGVGLPIRIPEAGGLTDEYRAIQEALHRADPRGGKAGFRNPRFAVGTGGVKGGTESLFAKGRGAGLDEVLDAYAPGASVNDALEALIRDIETVQEWKAVEGSVIKNGLEGGAGREFVSDPMEAAALGFGETPEAVAAVREAHPDVVLPESRLGPSPWAMSREDYHAEMAGIGDVLDTAPEDYSQWTPEHYAAEDRLAELAPEALGDVTGLDLDGFYDRLRSIAEEVGRDVKQERPTMLAAGEVGGAARGRAEARAQEAVQSDKDYREWANANDEPYNVTHLARTHLTRDEKAIYDQLTSGERADLMEGRAEMARLETTAEPRIAGEVAGQRVGEAEGKARLLTRQAGEAEARAERLGPKAEQVGAKAEEAMQERAGVAVRFGERRGKRQAEVLRLQRQLRNRERRLAWLEDERIPQLEARLAEGPRQVMPGMYQPPLMAAERYSDALGRMGSKLAEQTGNPWMQLAFTDLMADVPQSMKAMHERGLYPEYLPGGVDVLTGTRSSAGSQLQLPHERPAPSARQKGYGHIPRETRTVQRQMIRDIVAWAEQDAAELIRTKIAKTGHDIVAELVAGGALPEHRADVLTGPYRDRTVDFEAEMKRVPGGGYRAWDPEKSGLPKGKQVTPDSLFIPEALAKEFERWWRKDNPNGALRVYDAATRGFKHSVLGLSPSWQVMNVLGNAFMATAFSGESPLEIARQVSRVLKEKQATGAEFREHLPPEPLSTGRLSRAGRAVVNRTRPLRAGREWVRDVAAAPLSEYPPRLYGAGGHAEMTRQMAQLGEPRTGFGRYLNKSYRLNETVDDIGRTAVYLAKKGRGYDDETAVGMALRAMGDFNNMTHFEREYVRRILPFYAWMRHVTKASLNLAVEHPWRTAWLMQVSNLWGPKGDQSGVPDWLRGGLGLGGGAFIPFGGANPLQGAAGSVFTSPKNWPSEIMRSLNPVIKLGASALGGINLSQGRVVTRPPGTGTLTQFGNPLLGFATPQEMAYMALRQVPQGRLLTDLVYNPTTNEFAPRPVLRYDTGHAIKRQGRTIPQEGGRLAGAVRNLSIPFFPVYVNEAEVRARTLKAQRAARRAEATYNR